MSVSKWAINFKVEVLQVEWLSWSTVPCCSVLLLGKHCQSTCPGGASCSLSPDNSCKIKHSHILSSAGFYLMLPFPLIKNILKSSKEEKLVFPTSTGGVFPFSLADCCQPKPSLCSPWEQSELIPEPGKLSDIRTTTTSVVRVFTSAACKWLLLLPGTTKIKTSLWKQAAEEDIKALSVIIKGLILISADKYSADSNRI